jgi:hypothetical protein
VRQESDEDPTDDDATADDSDSLPLISHRGCLMSNIDRQRVAAVRKLEAMGSTFAAGD